MRKISFVIIIATLLAIPTRLKAERDSIPVLRDTTLEGLGLISQFSANLDSLLNLWYVQTGQDTANMLSVVESDSTVIETTPLPDSVYIQRLADMNSFIDLPYNSIVRNFINVYTNKQRDKVQIMLGLADFYFPIFEEILDRNSLPIELRILPVIESALNPRAVSRVGATGIWQFMYGTGRMYDLTINSYIDERRDPIASSHAAVRFLKDLYSIYGDWTLVIAAYNCGPGNVNKAIRRAGGKRSYWDIYYFLPRETRGYVPAFIAANYAFAYHSEHSITPTPMKLPATTDTIMVSGMLHLEQVSHVLNVPMKTLRDLNPQYKADIIPAKKKQMTLRLPFEAIGPFIDQQQEIFAYKDTIYFSPKNVIHPSRYTASYHHYVPAGSNRITYRVKEGDVLGTIAEQHGVRVSQLRSWNNIRGSMIRVGQKLTIYVKGPIGGQMSSAPKDADPNYIYYKVRRGDTLSGIAQHYPGISASDIKRANNLPNDRLMPGQTLKIKPKG
ncbi:MAG: LysM peptidoglycan-binding domain-containing protein [Bacteroidales bacterium]|nr:LysM peptidoglycan-binding domain-containing protein [Bacteroidales bacterium]MDY0348090.1 LysM peptidoglycan-binding domain-containing protein [Tenuifilaceae bacterium]